MLSSLACLMLRPKEGGPRETIISAIISAAAAIVVCLITQNRQAMKLEAQLDKQTALLEQRLGTLSDRVEKHNNVIERTYKLEELTALQEEKLKVANHRIDDLENKQCDAYEKRSESRHQNSS